MATRSYKLHPKGLKATSFVLIVKFPLEVVHKYSKYCAILPKEVFSYRLHPFKFVFYFPKSNHVGPIDGADSNRWMEYINLKSYKIGTINVNNTNFH